MLSSKGNGNGKGSPQKQAAARRVRTRSSNTKSNKQARIEETQFDTLAAISSPKPKPRSKKQSQRSKSTTSPSKKLNSPGSESGITASIVVTETKKKESQVESSSEDDESSTLSEGTKAEEQQSPTHSEESKKDEGLQNKEPEGDPATQANMSTTFDMKLEHVFNNYLSATGADHDIRKAFIHEQISTFEDFTGGCTVENVKTFQRNDGTSLVQAFSNVKLTMIGNVLNYYQFLMNDSQETLAGNPVSWTKSDFRKWITLSRGTATQTTAPQDTTTVTPPSTTKLEDDALLNWTKGRQDVTVYPVIDNDVQYPDWIIKIRLVFIGDECKRMIDKTKHFTGVNSGFDETLWIAQKNHLAKVLDHVLKSNEGMRLVRTYPDEPRKIRKLHEAHSTSSTTSSRICTMLSQSLATMKILEFSNPLEGLDKFDSNLQKFIKVSHYDKMTNNMAIMYLQAATHVNKDLLASWAQCENIHNLMNETAPTYEECYAYLLKFSKKVEAAITDDTTSRKANNADSSYLSPYSPDDDQYENATDMNSYMGERGDVDTTHDVLLCH